ADGAEQAACLTSDVRRHIDVVAFGERNLLRRVRAGVLQTSEMQGHQLCLRDLREHVGDPLLLELKAADRPIEHDAVLRVGERFLEAGNGGADRAQEMPYRPCVKHMKGPFNPPDFRSSASLGMSTSPKTSVTRVVARSEHF